MKTQRERLEEWAEKLTAESMKELIVELIIDGIINESIGFFDDTVSPYYRETGEPLVKGQIIYNDD